MNKTCAKCKQSLPLEQFRWKNKEKNQLQSYCIECNKEVNRQHFQKNKEKYAENRTAYRLIHGRRMRIEQYGITVEQFEELNQVSNGLCNLCLKRKATDIDHDHLTGRVRGVLCKQCNMGLGYFSDDVSVLSKAIGYLNN